MIRYSADNIEIKFSARAYGKWHYLMKSLREAWKRGEETMMIHGRWVPVK